MSIDPADLLPRVGESQGALVYVGPRRTFQPRLCHCAYGPETLAETCPAPLDVAPDLDPSLKHFVCLMGVHDPQVVGRVGGWFGLHPLALEDAMNTRQRPKIEELEDGTVFLVLKNVAFLPEERRACEEQVCIAWGAGFVLVLGEAEGNPFEPVLQRLRKGKGRTRSQGLDYLVVALLDAVMDRYRLALGLMGEAVEFLEDRLDKRVTEQTLLEIYRLKREIFRLRNSFWPAQEALNELLEQQIGHVEDQTLAFLRDVHDHAAQVGDELRTLHDSLASMLNVQISLASMRMNDIMKVLTVIATIFIPLTFVAGVYGMNFRLMPELGWEYGYPAVLCLMAAVAAGMVLYFHRKKWF